MAGTRKVWGAKEIGLRGTLLKAGSDGGIEIPLADVDEVVKAFGLSLAPPAPPAKPERKVDPERKAKVDALIERAKALGESVPDGADLLALYLDAPDAALAEIDAGLAAKEKAKAAPAPVQAAVVPAAPSAPAQSQPPKKGGKG